jgi:hypothetical protein
MSSLGVLSYASEARVVLRVSVQSQKKKSRFENSETDSTSRVLTGPLDARMVSIGDILAEG